MEMLKKLNLPFLKKKEDGVDENGKKRPLTKEEKKRKIKQEINAQRRRARQETPDPTQTWFAIFFHFLCFENFVQSHRNLA